MKKPGATVISITNQKGGTGKTTTALALAAGLFLKGYKVLSIDLDQQSNFTYTINSQSNTGTILDILNGETSADETIQKTKQYGDIIPAQAGLAGADAYITGNNKEYRLKDAIEPIKEKYDYIILDTPPALGIITVNALTACDCVIIPAQADIYSIQGITQLAETIKLIKKYSNPNLKIAGILLTRYSPRSVLSREVAQLADQMAAKLNTRLYTATIREGIVIKEAQISQRSLFDYAPRAHVTEDYTRFIDEFIQNEKEGDRQ